MNPPIKEEYILLYEEYYSKILDLLKYEGKNGFIKKQKQKNLHSQSIFYNMINDINYYLTNLDIWILLLKFQIPSIFISSFHMKIMDVDHKFTFTVKTGDAYVVIVAPTLSELKVPIYRCISDGDNIFLKDFCNIVEEPIDLGIFLKNHVVLKRTDYLPQKIRMERR
jgi:hypothetical protein